MRFAAATAVLVNTLPATFKSVSVVAARQDEEHLLRSKLYARISDRRLLPEKSLAPQRRKFRTGRLFKKMTDTGDSHSKECDPDVGLLACGFGQYCDDTLESALGGICVPLSRFGRRLQTNSGSALPNNSSATATSSPTISPGNVTDVTTLSGPGVYCDPSSPYYGGLECDCLEWNILNQTGAIYCKFAAESCVEECENTCFSVDFNYKTDGSIISYQYCYQFVKPTQQQFCLSYSNDQTCMFSIDESSCTSCNTSYRLNCDYGTCFSEGCSNFDCENIGFGKGNSCYDSVVPPAYYECYLDLNGLYPSCSLCSDGTIVYPEEYFDLPGYGSFNCSYIDSLAGDGLLNPQQCTYATVLATSACCQRDKSEEFTCNICEQEGQVVSNGKFIVGTIQCLLCILTVILLTEQIAPCVCSHYSERHH